MPRASFLLRPCGPAAMGGTAGGMVTVNFAMSLASVVTIPVTVTGLHWHGNGQKNSGRYEESHHNSLPLSCVLSGVRPEQARSPDAGWPVRRGQKDAIAGERQAAWDASLARRDHWLRFN